MSLTLGAHAQRRLRYLVRVSVCLSVCLSVYIRSCTTGYETELDRLLIIARVARCPSFSRNLMLNGTTDI